VLGNRRAPVNFGYQKVTSEQCLSCHERPNERHPIYRFNEPRFTKIRQTLAVNSCLGCHSEHQNSRVSVSPTACSHCHDDLTLKNEPLDIAHEQLVTTQAWESCLGCHDFHGNHQHKPQTLVSNAFETELIKAYFVNGPSPYGDAKHYKAKSDD